MFGLDVQAVREIKNMWHIERTRTFAITSARERYGKKVYMYVKRMSMSKIGGRWA